MSEFKRDAAEYQCSQHDKHRQIEGWHDDRVCGGKRRKQAATTNDQPCLIAVPNGLDGGGHHVPLFFRLRDRGEHANAEIEPVKQDVHHDADGEDQGPDEG